MQKVFNTHENFKLQNAIEFEGNDKTPIYTSTNLIPWMAFKYYCTNSADYVLKHENH